MLNYFFKILLFPSFVEQINKSPYDLTNVEKVNFKAIKFITEQPHLRACVDNGFVLRLIKAIEAEVRMQ